MKTEELLVLKVTNETIRLVPIASVITPATLSVIVAPVAPPVSTLVNVPRADFSSLKFAAPGGEDTLMTYSAPTLEVNRIALASAVAGTILPIASPHLNASWELAFPGPKLKCSNVSDSFRRQIQHNILTAWVNGSVCQDYKNYISWTANTGVYAGTDATVSNGKAQPFDQNPLPFWSEFSFALNQGSLGPANRKWSRNQTSIPTVNVTDPATIYFAINPSVGVTRTVGMCNDTYDEIVASDYSGYWDDALMLQCELQNTTYSTRFNYTNGVQQIDVSFPDLPQAVPVSPLWQYYIDWSRCGTLNIDFDATGHERPASNCTIDPVILQRLSYQSIMDAFGQILRGSVHLTAAGASSASTIVSMTDVLSTPLLHTEELSFMTNETSWTLMDYYANSLNYTIRPEMQALWDWSVPIAKRSMADVLEEMFQNITISMLSSQELQPNASSAAIQPVSVTFHDYHTVYAYAAATLWLAYGIAIAITLVGVIIGLACIIVTGATFSDNFSTIMRATRNAEVSVDIKEQDSDGRDPLPKYIEQANVTFIGSAFSTATRQGSETVEETHVQPKTPLLIRRVS